MALDKHSAKRLSIRIAHETAIIADVWEVRTFDGTSPADTHNFYVVLRDTERTEIHDDDAWLRYTQAHPERLRKTVRTVGESV